MTGDGKIGLQVSNVVRIGAVRRLSGHATEAAPAPLPAKPADPVAAAGLIGLAADIASQPTPVDGARVAAIRSAIAEGRYQLDPGATARAMLDHYTGGAA